MSMKIKEVEQGAGLLLSVGNATQFPPRCRFINGVLKRRSRVTRYMELWECSKQFSFTRAQWAWSEFHLPTDCILVMFHFTINCISNNNTTGLLK